MGQAETRDRLLTLGLPINMKQILTLFFMLVILVPAGAQKYIGKNREEIEKIIREINPNGVITGSDSILILSTSPDHQTNINFTCHFSPGGKCRIESYSSVCNSCYRDLLAMTLGQKKYRWKKINGNQYISKYRSRLLLETDPDPGKNSFRIIQTSWTRKIYKMLEP